MLLYSNYPFAGFKDFLSSINFGTFFFESDAHCLLLEFSNTSGTSVLRDYIVVNAK